MIKATPNLFAGLCFVVATVLAFVHGSTWSGILFAVLTALCAFQFAYARSRA